MAAATTLCSTGAAVVAGRGSIDTSGAGGWRCPFEPRPRPRRRFRSRTRGRRSAMGAPIEDARCAGTGDGTAARARPAGDADRQPASAGTRRLTAAHSGLTSSVLDVAQTRPAYRTPEREIRSDAAPRPGSGRSAGRPGPRPGRWTRRRRPGPRRGPRAWPSSGRGWCRRRRRCRGPGWPEREPASWRWRRSSCPPCDSLHKGRVDLDRPGTVTVRVTNENDPACLLQVVAELLASGGAAQLGEGLGLDLADPLAGDPELAADLLQGPGVAVGEAEAELDDLLLPLREGVQDRVELLLEQDEAGRVHGHDGVGVLDEVAEVGVLLLTDRGLQRHRLLGHLEDLADLLG